MDWMCPWKKPALKIKRISFCHNIIEMHPVCFWVTWICVTLFSLLSALCLTGYMDWKMCAYSVFILSCMIIFIIIAIIHLRHFGKELQHNLGFELDEAMCGQNRVDRPESLSNMEGVTVTTVQVKNPNDIKKNMAVQDVETYEESNEFTRL